MSLTVGRPEHRWLFYAHGVVGFAIVVLLFWKLRRVRRRITDRSRWDRTTPVSILAALVASGALVTGVLWAFGVHQRVLYWEFLMLHMALGVLLMPLVLVHLAGRYRPPRRADFGGRRTVLTYLALGATGALAWRAQSAINRLLGTPGADRRFTGSRERGSFADNAFPTTSWVADDPDPIDPGGVVPDGGRRYLANARPRVRRPRAGRSRAQHPRLYERLILGAGLDRRPGR
jgi:hypothetical protein